MKKTIETKWFGIVCAALQEAGRDFRTAFKVIDEKTVVKASWRFKPNGRNSREEMVVTFGAPNYEAREFIKKCKKAGEPFPVKKVQLRAYPKKK